MRDIIWGWFGMIFKVFISNYFHLEILILTLRKSIQTHSLFPNLKLECLLRLSLNMMFVCSFTGIS